MCIDIRRRYLLCVTPDGTVTHERRRYILCAGVTRCWHESHRDAEAVGGMVRIEETYNQACPNCSTGWEAPHTRPVQVKSEWAAERLRSQFMLDYCRDLCRFLHVYLQVQAWGVSRLRQQVQRLYHLEWACQRGGGHGGRGGRDSDPRPPAGLDDKCTCLACSNIIDRNPSKALRRELTQRWYHELWGEYEGEEGKMTRFARGNLEAEMAQINRWSPVPAFQVEPRDKDNFVRRLNFMKEKLAEEIWQADRSRRIGGNSNNNNSSSSSNNNNNNNNNNKKQQQRQRQQEEEEEEEKEKEKEGEKGGDRAAAAGGIPTDDSIEALRLQERVKVLLIAAIFIAADTGIPDEAVTAMFRDWTPFLFPTNWHSSKERRRRGNPAAGFEPHGPDEAYLHVWSQEGYRTWQDLWVLVAPLLDLSDALNQATRAHRPTRRAERPSVLDLDACLTRTRRDVNWFYDMALHRHDRYSRDVVRFARVGRVATAQEARRKALCDYCNAAFGHDRGLAGGSDDTGETGRRDPEHPVRLHCCGQIVGFKCMFRRMQEMVQATLWSDEGASFTCDWCQAHKTLAIERRPVVPAPRREPGTKKRAVEREGGHGGGKREENEGRSVPWDHPDQQDDETAATSTAAAAAAA